MTDRAGGTPLRWFRAGLLALVASLAGAIAHVSAGGRLPSATSVVLLVAILTCLCAALLGRVASKIRVVALVIGGQTFIHVALTVLAGHAGPSPPSAHHAPGPPTSAQPAPPMDQVLVPNGLTHVVPDLTGPDALMTVAHLCAGAAIGLWLASGERALFTLLALMAGAALRVCTTPAILPASRSATLAVPARVACRPRIQQSHSFGRRGPPHWV